MRNNAIELRGLLVILFLPRCRKSLSNGIASDRANVDIVLDPNGSIRKHKLEVNSDNAQNIAKHPFMSLFKIGARQLPLFAMMAAKHSFTNYLSDRARPRQMLLNSGSIEFHDRRAPCRGNQICP